MKAARRWFDQCLEGAPDVVDVAEACRRYVEDRRSEKGEATAADAEGRFRRRVYQAPIGKVLLHELRAAHLTDWRNGLVVIDGDEEDPDADRFSQATRDLIDAAA